MESMHFYQTKTIHASRAWRLYFAVLPRLQLVLICWTAFLLLTGCNPPSALTPYQLTPSGPATPAYMVSLHDLQLEYKQETFKQFFTERQAEAIWHRLRLCLAPAGIFGGIDETSIDQDTTMNAMLFKHRPHVEADLRKAITLYIGYQKQLCLLSMQGITQEIAFGNLLLSNELGEMWDRLQSAKNDSKDAVDLSGMLEGLPEIVQIHVLQELIPWINKHIHVLALDLSSNSLTMLPESMGDLSNLCQLNLSHNSLTLLPDSIGNLGNLRSLVIKGNLLTRLPDSIGNLRNLRSLVIKGNLLTRLPDSIGNLGNLSKLDLFYNQLALLPDSIGDLHNLSELVLSSNRLTVLPISIGNLTNLHTLYLTDNQLTSLPDSIGNLRNLRSLVIKGNLLTRLPDSIGNLRSLSKLDLFYNELTLLPDSIGALSNLSQLNLSHNNLTELPKFIVNLPNLIKLNISSNGLTLLPEFIGNLSKLRKLNVSGNNLTELPEFIGNLSNLYALYIGNNQLTVLPGSLKKLSMLSDFRPYYNPLLKPLSRKGIGVLLTSSNLPTLLFPSLTELAALYIAQNQIPYRQENCTLPPDCISRIENPKTYPVILFTTQLGDITLSQSIPITTNLSYEQILDQVGSRKEVILLPHSSLTNRSLPTSAEERFSSSRGNLDSFITAGRLLTYFDVG